MAKKATSKVPQNSKSSTTTMKRAVATTTAKRANLHPVSKAQPSTTLKRAPATTKKQTPLAAPSRTLLGLSPKTWIGSCRLAKGAEARTGSRGYLIALDTRDAKKTRALASPHLNRMQMDLLLASEQELMHFQGSQGPVSFLRLVPSAREQKDLVDATLSKSPYARGRDHASSILSNLLPYKVDKFIVELDGIPHDQRQGVLFGLELAAYAYSENCDNPRKARKKLPTLLLRSSSEEISPGVIKSTSNLAFATNLARHLVNTPPNKLNPRTYAEFVESLFADDEAVKVTTWEGQKLIDERMNLMLAVGGASDEGPRLVHIQYRPKTAKPGQRPVAIVGKGITFDSGGLDIKPSSGMRWMKKDMGGSAAAVAIAQWAVASELELPLDIYLALAENSISGRAFRPGDVITSRAGLTVEIQNTDAEGRLVLADAMDVAITAEEKPVCLIDLATLTGAIKVGLGAEIAGLFSNNDHLADDIVDAGAYRGDFVWRMPLFQSYKSMLRSTFADYANSADGYAGAITAALFLESFVGDVPWAHLDIYSWKDGAGGAYSESGGNGQPVQLMAELLTRFAMSADGLE